MPLLTSILMGASLANSMFEQFSEDSLNRSMAASQMSHANTAIHELTKQKELLGSIYENLKKPVTDRFGNALLKTTIGSNNLYKKSNMAYSGTIEQSVGLQNANIKDQFESELMNLEMNKANQESAIDSQIAKLEGERDIYRLRSKHYSPLETFFKPIANLF